MSGKTGVYDELRAYAVGKGIPLEIALVGVDNIGTAGFSWIIRPPQYPRRSSTPVRRVVGASATNASFCALQDPAHPFGSHRPG
jgi:hypothetical protein